MPTHDILFPTSDAPSAPPDITESVNKALALATCIPEPTYLDEKASVAQVTRRNIQDTEVQYRLLHSLWGTCDSPAALLRLMREQRELMKHNCAVRGIEYGAKDKTSTPNSYSPIE